MSDPAKVIWQGDVANFLTSTALAVVAIGEVFNLSWPSNDFKVKRGRGGRRKRRARRIR